MTEDTTSDRDPIAMLERANPVSVGTVPPDELAAARARVDQMIANGVAVGAPAGAGRSLRARRLRTGIGLAAVTVTAAVPAVVILTSRSAGGARAGQAVSAGRTHRRTATRPAPILHVDFSDTLTEQGGQRWPSRQDTWTQEGAPFNQRTVFVRSPRQADGIAGATIEGAEEIYLPQTDTIYIAPVQHPKHPAPPSVMPNPLQGMTPFEYRFPDQLRRQVASGQARVVGHVRFAGRRAIQISAGAGTTYYVAPGAYRPIGEVSTGQRSTNTYVFYTWRLLPGTDRRVFSLTALHPRARVDHSLAAFRRALKHVYG